MFEHLNSQLITSLSELNQFALRASKLVEPGMVIGLDGPLGAGKTTFVQFLLKHLGITQDVVSPTFTIMHQYPWKKGSLVYHLDCYRLRRIDEVLGIGLTEIIEEKKHLILIEWPGVAKPVLPDSTLALEFTILPNNHRKIEVKRSNQTETI